MKLRISFFFCFCFIMNGLAQKEAAIWYFGSNAGLDFNSGAPVALTDGAMFTREGCATISDSNGTLLFYTNGVTVWSRNHNPMPNGFGLFGHESSTQAAIIIPYVGIPNSYIIFTLDQGGEGKGLNYSIVDMSLNGGLGDVTTKNTHLSVDVTEKITAVKHTNGTDIWVVTHRYKSNEFLAYLVTASGVSATPVITAVGEVHTGDYGGIGSLGSMKASPNGEFIALTTYSSYVHEVFRFNSTTGVLSNPLNLESFFDTRLPSDDFKPDIAYGVEFSPDNTKIYYTIGSYPNPYVRETSIYQLDISNYDLTTILGTAIQITPTIPGSYGAMQLGLDGKIYVANSGENYLSVIKNPNSSATDCDFELEAIQISPGSSLFGLPQFITSYFNLGIEAVNFCFGDSTEFGVYSRDPIVGILWDFGDGVTSILENPSHNYTVPGEYTVTALITTATTSKTETREITIYDVPTANAPTNYEVCSLQDIVEFDLSLKDAEVLGSQSATDFSITYFKSQLEAEENCVDPLPKLYSNTYPIETVYARIENANSSLCYQISSFDLIVKKAAVLHPVADWTACDSNSDGFYNFDVSQKDVEVLNGQYATEFRVQYFETLADAVGNTNAVATNYQNTSNRQELYFRIHNITDPECFETGSFTIEVIPAIIANTPSNILVCDTDLTNDGFTTFNLENKDTEVLGGQNSANFNIDYYASQEDANIRSNPLDKVSYTNAEAFQETIYARIEPIDWTNCYETTSFIITVNLRPQPPLNNQYVICADSPNPTIDGGDFETWEWYDELGNILSGNQFFTVTELGVHSLRVTQTTNGLSCENTVSFVVVSSDLPEDFKVNNSGFSDLVTLEVEVNGFGDFEYSVDGINYQDSSVITVYPGVYTVSVRDKLLCRTLSKEVIALGYQKFFTPNGDTINEYWNISGAEYFPDAQIFIFDRIGKVIKQMKPNDLGWDGTYSGKPLPESDYWFSFQQSDGKKYSGHFTLKR
ncbi:T9SS type B sorting domain-containing protein [Cellulophaga sp. F20128]|uniref:T9SS type B sorting domain-containing protein n=1 Tax=Cellulophaga sp. F20128 TaxID=2926413 RepID=UPI001FF5694D|nr:T9SS type B sorting domain-containing protein [Cellulophaga sp. F20128]MCK0156327.1 T9SS type B sorting domain-containing protein [Cellulophaga sp. F20128]